MDHHQLNLLVKKICLMKEQLHQGKSNRIFLETLKMLISVLHEKYGIYLNEMLFEVYEEYTAGSKMEALENYLHPEGVSIRLTDKPGEIFALKIKPFPLRLVIEQDDFSRSLKVA